MHRESGRHEAGARNRRALILLTSLFFMWGLITSLNDILVPHFKAAFELTYVRAMLIQFCFFGAYFVMSFPSGYLVERLGYRQGIIIGLAIACLACVLFYPAASLNSYAFFLVSLFVLASGITLLQVAANPYVAVLGPPESASSRLNLTQAFNSLGTTVGPYLGALLILSGGRAADVRQVQGPYLVLAATLGLIAAVFALSPLPRAQDLGREEAEGAGRGERDAPSVWSQRHLLLGAAAIFVYVGSEVCIGSFLVSFMGQPDIAALPAAVAGKHVSLYWGGAMLGRFIGSAAMLRLRPAHVLTFNALVAAALVAAALSSVGPGAMWALLAVGLFNSIMFPTIFTLAIDGLGERTGEGSGVLCMAIVGGAILPVLQGKLADAIGLRYSFIVPLIGYLFIAFYGMKGYRHDHRHEGASPHQ